MGKRVVYTKITPLPSSVPRQLAIELLHSHQEVIELNPLVTGVKAIEAPRDSPNDEYFSQWYEISEVITWGFGLRKKIAFKGVFHDLPYGLQSHVYAPMGVDLRNKYRIGGNQPGEPRETRELGVDTPLDGLYLREDVEIVCNIALASFVKKETKEATGKMVQRLAKKAELLDEGKLHAMFEDGMLKTAKPSGYGDAEGSVGISPPGSPSPSSASGFTAPHRLDNKGFGKYHDVARSPRQSQYRNSQYMPALQQQGYNGPDYARPGADRPGHANMPMINELPGSYQYPAQGSPGLYPNSWKSEGQSFRSELPGDSIYTAATSPQPSPRAPSQSSVDAKPQYQAYLPPSQQQPTEGKHSYPNDNTNGSPPEASASREQSFSGPSSANISVWQQSVASTSQLSVGRRPSASDGRSSYEQQLRPASNIVPDHQRFSNMSIQEPPMRNPKRLSVVQAPQQQQQQQQQPQYNAKCPVCGLFEGDEIAISHHVSKVHFS